MYEGVERCAVTMGEVSWSPTADGYRLPTEAEWEFAARAGSAFTSDTDAVAWFRGNSGRETHPVAQKRANAWGFFDMRGNVWEWVWDRYGDYGNRSSDPRGADTGLERVGRGGGYNGDAVRVRVAMRVRGKPTDRDTDVGLRLARTVP